MDEWTNHRMDQSTILPARLREHALAHGAVLKPPGSARHREGVTAANLDGPDFVVPAVDRDTLHSGETPLTLTLTLTLSRLALTLRVFF